MVAKHVQDGGRRGAPALLLAFGDDEPGGDVAEVEVLCAQVQGNGEHGVVGDSGAADGLAAVYGI
ncbi:hypothetical protein [Nonomuraea wenchangensis]|uniref:hypothetical protein n=1 Tax=Nonomuraea wenchangensis TaxID=568860 RepID=UPI0037A47705